MAPLLISVDREKTTFWVKAPESDGDSGVFLICFVVQSQVIALKQNLQAQLYHEKNS